jgi:PAS domain S-box-containing protein
MEAKGGMKNNTTGKVHNTKHEMEQNTRLTIGYLLENVHAYQLTVWSGSVDAARKHEINLLTFQGRAIQDPREFRAQGNIIYDLVTTEHLNGLIIGPSMGSYVSKAELEAFCRRYAPLPMVSISSSLENIPNLIVDNRQGLHDLLAHLIVDHGYRRISFIKGPEENPTANHRYQTYTEVLAQYGIPLDPDLILPGAFTSDSGEEAIAMLLDQRRLQLQSDVEVVVAANDEMAFGALEELHVRGIRVPDTVAVTGFDDLSASRHSIPPLTTVRPTVRELGMEAVEMILALLRGEELPKLVQLPTVLIIRQSCGCPSQAVVRARVESIETSAPEDPMRSLGESLSAVQKAHLLSEVEPALQDLQGSDQDPIQTERIEHLLNAFWSDLQGEHSNTFVPTLSEVLNEVIMAGRDVVVWQDVLSVLRRQIVGSLLEYVNLGRVENLWQQARVVLEEKIQQAHMRQSIAVKQQAQTLRELSQTLITTFHVDQLMDVLAERLPQLGIKSGYLCLYNLSSESPDIVRIPEWSRLVLAYHDQRRLELSVEGQLFRSQQILPEGMLSQTRRYEMTVIPLYFQEHQLGFVLFEAELQEGMIYEVLRGEISSALQGALLVQRVQERSAEIARQKYILDTFMANVPDSIYFKDHNSRIIRSNQAHAAAFGIANPQDLIGKSDFDFFSEEQARPKYEQEQEIIRTGQPLLALEEPDAGGRWALTTKMPLRDEHGEIIGTFGISRDITELKQAQHALEHAYSEISKLNEQLKEENLRMSAELDIARRLQKMILPPAEELQQIQGLEIVGYMQPADEVGGDYYDVLKENGVIHIGIGDVTGHGLESGVLMLMTQTAIRTLIEHGETDPVAFVNTLNRTIYKNAQRMGADKTLTFALIDYQNGQLKIVGQHEEMLIVRHDGQVERMDTIDLGFPIGLEEEIAQWVAAATVTLQPEDGVVLYTDGITEAANMNNELYGVERLCEVVSQQWEKSAEEVKRAVVEDVTRYIGKQKVYDDLTLVVLKQK